MKIPPIRIKKYPKGFVVEKQYRTWYGIKRWKFIISPLGSVFSNEPWYFTSREGAMQDAERQFKRNIILNTNYNEKSN